LNRLPRRQCSVSRTSRRTTAARSASLCGMQTGTSYHCRRTTRRVAALTRAPEHRQRLLAPLHGEFRRCSRVRVIDEIGKYSMSLHAGHISTNELTRGARRPHRSSGSSSARSDQPACPRPGTSAATSPTAISISFSEQAQLPATRPARVLAGKVAD
jgi:hypothetical protein